MDVVARAMAKQAKTIAAGTTNGETVDARTGADSVARATLGALVREIHQNTLNNNTNLSDASKIAQTLTHGTSVISGTLDSPIDVEVQGRTLVSMGSSILQNGKQFLLADKKTKIRTLGSKTAQITGVSKFVQTIPTTDTANFVGKVMGSTVENPHKGGWTQGSSLVAPSGTINEFGTQSYQYVSSLNGVSEYFNNVKTNGYIYQQIFSFDIISEIERQIGRIPKDTLADKVQWCKNNIDSVNCNWYGYGSGPSGNKANLALFRADSQVYSGPVSHTNGTVSKLSYGNNTGAIFLQSDGFCHFLAYADASDGVTASVVNTDYVELVIALSASAQLDNRPILSRIANFEGKVSGSTVEVPHVGKAATSVGLGTPSSFSGIELPQNYYSEFAKLGGTLPTTAPTSGQIGQQLFQFDVIQEIERQLGRIPKATLADKVQWCKDNLLIMTCNWYGYGSSVGGNKASLSGWINGSWYAPNGNGTNSPSLIPFNIISSISTSIDANGFVYFLAYADPAGPVANPTVAPTLSASGSGSGLAAGTYYVQYAWEVNGVGYSLPSPEASITITAGQNIVVNTPALPFGVSYADIYISTTSGGETYQGTTFGSSASNPTYTRSTALVAGSALPTTNTAIVASTINTDYVELQIELKQGVTLHDPVVPLYQIDDTTEYGNILTTWDETTVLNRYPKVQGVQHLQNVYAIAEGENLIPPFTDPGWNYGVSSYRIISPYEFELTATAAWQSANYKLPAAEGQNYTLSNADPSGMILLQFLDVNSVRIGLDNASPNGGSTTKVAPAGTKYINISCTTSIAGTFNFVQPMLTLGSTAKPFVPRNPSYLFATAKLGQIGTMKDVLYKNDGQWYVRKSVEKDVVLDGTFGFVMGADYTGYKRFYKANYSGIKASSDGYGTGVMSISKYTGQLLNIGETSNTTSDRSSVNSAGDLYVSVSDADTGFGDAYSPLTAEIQAYFYGWQAKTVDGTGKPTAWRSLGDGTDAPTQTLAYVSVTKAPNFTPYKLSYVLATPTVVTATVEGDIALNGPTQVEVGSGVIVREKVVPQAGLLSNNVYTYINTDGSGSNQPVAKLKYKADKFMKIYKNSLIDLKWTFANNYAYGNIRAYISTTDFDATAEYTITYLVLDRQLFTNYATEFKTSYDSSLKSVVDNLVEKQSDLFAMGSVNVQAIAELYKRVKALGG